MVRWYQSLCKMSEETEGGIKQTKETYGSDRQG